MLIQMIYVDGTKCDSLPIVRHRPLTSKWSMDLLREREEAELETGGCGLGDKEPPYEEEEDYGFPEDIEVIYNQMHLYTSMFVYVFKLIYIYAHVYAGVYLEAGKVYRDNPEGKIMF